MNFVAPGDMKKDWDDVKERSNDLKKSDQIVERSMKLDICELAGKEASRFRKEFQKTSRLIRQSQKIDEWRWSDLEIGTLLGTGTFCQVYEVSLRKNCKLQANEIITGAESFRSHSMGENEGKSKLSPKYALKRLNPKYVKGSDDFSDCAIDLVMEAGILACLHHPNIVRLRAVAAGSISNSFKRQGGYFLVLSRLSGTLSERISQWANEEILISTQKKSVRLKDRLGMIVFGVARGMEYLHKNKVIFR
jgi:serine/threonine protein kinase